MIITDTTQKKNTNFGYKAIFEKKAFENLSHEMKDPLNNYSHRIIKDIDEGMDVFNNQIAAREGVPNLHEAQIVIDDFKTTIGNGRGREKLLYGFDVKGLPADVDKFIHDEMEFRPKLYYISIPNKDYNKKDAKPFEKALNKMFQKIKNMIDKYNEIENGLKVIKDKHVEVPGEWD
jgi:hypothetical protein